MDINNTISRIVNEPLSQNELYGIAHEALRQDFLEPGVRKFFNDILGSTKHMAILGCGYPLDYELMVRDAKTLLSSTSV